MTFLAESFQPSWSLRRRTKGRQEYSYDAGSDLLATVLAADFFLTKYKELNVGDLIRVITDAGEYLLEVITSSSTGVTTARANTVQSLSGAGAVDTISELTEVTSTSTDALTLIDGAIGQIKKITLIVDGGTATLTPTTGLGYSTIAFADAGDSVVLQFMTGGWAMIGHGGLSGGPVAS